MDVNIKEQNNIFCKVLHNSLHKMQAATGRRTFWVDHERFAKLGKSTRIKFERCSYAKGKSYLIIYISDVLT